MTRPASFFPFAGGLLLVARLLACSSNNGDPSPGGVGPPKQTCTTAVECGVPSPVCVGSDNQMLFSDPSCDDGQCHWAQVVLECSGGACDGPSGQCYQPIVGGSETAAPLPPVPMLADQPPSPPPAQACTRAADCKQPAPTCYSDDSFVGSFVVSYIDPACEQGSCVWEMSLSECPAACSRGACADVQCRKDTDCAPWPPTCHPVNDGWNGGYGGPGAQGAWEVHSCAKPSCSEGSCVCNPYPKVTACPETSATCTDGVCGP